MEEQMNTDEIGVEENITSEETVQDKKNKKDDTEKDFNAKKEFFSWVRIILFAIVIAFVINNFIIINANVPTGSMQNTIMAKDRMIGLRTAYWFSEPERGDVVIFKNPDDESETFVKRLIGMPGDKVVIKDAKIYINDSKEPLKEDYLPEEWINVNGSDRLLEYQVPEDGYFMLGDNRNFSRDARFWNNTYVKRSQIIAKAEFVYWPWPHKGMLKTADYTD